MAPLLTALLLLAQLVPSEARRADLGPSLAGSDFLLVTEAAGHPAMRGANLACYRIYVFDEDGRRRVAFVAARNSVTETETENGTVIAYEPPDPRCRSISFVMGASGRVERVIYTRH